MGRRARVDGNVCMGLSTPRSVCLNCTLPECVYEHGEPRVFAPKENPEEVYIIKKTRTKIKTGEELTTYLTQFPTTKINAGRGVEYAMCFTLDEAKRAVEICKARIKLATRYLILRKDEEIERINNSE